MKPQKIEFEGPFVDDQGHLHTDTGNIWHFYMPEAFWTTEARRLFQAAAAAGIIRWNDEAETFAAGTGITKAQLAYWCKLASSYLGLDRGGTTSWKPFEKVFNGPGQRWPDRSGYLIKTEAQTPLKASLWCLKNQPQYSEKRPTNAAGYRLDQVEFIDTFFETLKASTNEQ